MPTQHVDNYHTYAASSPLMADAVRFTDEAVDCLSIPTGKVTRVSPRSFRVDYTEEGLRNFCHYEVSRRNSREHFSVKITLVLDDGTVALTRRCKDITAESLAEIIQGLYASVKVARSKANSEKDAFRKFITDSLVADGYTCDGTSPIGFTFRGKMTSVAITMSELGMFKAVIRVSHKKGRQSDSFVTGGAISVDNAERLVSMIRQA